MPYVKKIDERKRIELYFLLRKLMCLSCVLIKEKQSNKERDFKIIPIRALVPIAIKKVFPILSIPVTVPKH
tara:strand:+ start:180 stop:392 length:213 start_codon:yes stop_codon:yes gene_type:complete